MWPSLSDTVLKTLRGVYSVFVKSEAVYLYQMIPITYFMTIIARLFYYKLKYRLQIYFRDVIAVATTLMIFLDYLNYLRLLISGTGRILPFEALLLKYTIGFLLWVWMFWYSYQVHVKNNLKGKQILLKKRHAVALFVVSMIVILFIIGIVLAPSA